MRFEFTGCKNRRSRPAGERATARRIELVARVQLAPPPRTPPGGGAPAASVQYQAETNPDQLPPRSSRITSQNRHADTAHQVAVAAHRGARLRSSRGDRLLA